MRGKRLRQTIRLFLTLSVGKRADYIRKEKIFASFGEKSSIMDRVIPLYANLIKIGNNVHIASNVHFITHDITHVMLNLREKEKCAGGTLKLLDASKLRIMYSLDQEPRFLAMLELEKM